MNHEDILRKQDAVLAETQKWMKLAKMELNHKREQITHYEETYRIQGVTIACLNQKIEEKNEKISVLKSALLQYGTKIAEQGQEIEELKKIILHYAAKEEADHGREDIPRQREGSNRRTELSKRRDKSRKCKCHS